jgi:hypothetical protein
MAENPHFHHYKRTITVLVIILIVFAAIFLLAFFGLQQKQAIFDIGMPVEFENWVIMILCIASIIKIVWELYKIEVKN